MLTALLVIIYIAFISLGLPDSLLGSAWPVIRGDLQAPLSAAGVVAMVVTGGTIVSSLLSNRMIKRFGTGKVTCVSVLLTAASLLGFSYSDSVFSLCLLAVPLGLGAGAVDAGLNNFVALHYEAQHMNWLHCFWGIGATAGPVIISLYLMRENGWRYGYLTISLIQFGLTAALLLTLPLWKRVENGQERTESEGGGDRAGGQEVWGQEAGEHGAGEYDTGRCEAVKRTAAGVATSGSAVGSTVGSGAAESGTAGSGAVGSGADGSRTAESSQKGLLSSPLIKVSLVSFFCYCGLELTVGLWGSSYLVVSRGVSADLAAKWVSLFYFGITAGRLAAGFLSMRFNTRSLIRMGISLIFCGVLVFFMPVHSEICMAGFVLIGLGCAPIYPSMLHDTPDKVGSRNSQALMGIQMAVAYVGSTLMPPVFGFLASYVGTGIFPIYVLAALALMTVCVERTNVLMKNKSRMDGTHGFSKK